MAEAVRAEGPARGLVEGRGVAPAQAGRAAQAEAVRFGTQVSSRVAEPGEDREVGQGQGPAVAGQAEVLVPVVALAMGRAKAAVPGALEVVPVRAVGLAEEVAGLVADLASAEAQVQGPGVDRPQSLVNG